MKLISALALSLFLICTQIYAKEVPVLKPSVSEPIDLSETALKKWEEAKKLFESGKEYEKMTKKEKELYDSFDETIEGPWDLSEPCGFYCAGGPEPVKASSTLKSQGNSDYKLENIEDLDIRTAWIEGKDDYGIGESVEFAFDRKNITQIIIYNGYQKSKEAWENNSRVKRLKLYTDKGLTAILEVQDTRGCQTFDIDIESSKYKFVIDDIYEGKKWKDTAISEIDFDGPSH